MLKSLIEANNIYKSYHQGGVEINVHGELGGLTSIDQCAIACKDRASMFAFGTNAFGDNRCWRDGCKCLCETAAHNDGTCDISEHMGYNLYRFTNWEFAPPRAPRINLMYKVP